MKNKNLVPLIDRFELEAFKSFSFLGKNDYSGKTEKAND
jgi:hypothetical protein